MASQIQKQVTQCLTSFEKLLKNHIIIVHEYILTFTKALTLYLNKIYSLYPYLLPYPLLLRIISAGLIFHFQA
jgi:hypothetical protein